MTFLSDAGFWKELGRFLYEILFCVIGVGVGISALAFLIALVVVFVGKIRKALE